MDEEGRLRDVGSCAGALSGFLGRCESGGECRISVWVGRESDSDQVSVGLLQQASIGHSRHRSGRPPTHETPPSRKRWKTASLPRIGCLPSRMRNVPSILDLRAMTAASSLALVGLDVYSVSVVLEGIGGTMRVG